MCYLVLILIAGPGIRECIAPGLVTIAKLGEPAWSLCCHQVRIISCSVKYASLLCQLEMLGQLVNLIIRISQ